MGKILNELIAIKTKRDELDKKHQKMLAEMQRLTQNKDAVRSKIETDIDQQETLVREFASFHVYSEEYDDYRTDKVYENQFFTLEAVLVHIVRWSRY